MRLFLRKTQYPELERRVTGHPPSQHQNKQLKTCWGVHVPKVRDLKYHASVEESFQFVEMDYTRIMHVRTNLLEKKCNVRSHEGEILECSQKTAEEGRI